MVAMTIGVADTVIFADARRRLGIGCREDFLPNHGSTKKTIQREAIVFELGVQIPPGGFLARGVSETDLDFCIAPVAAWWIL